MKLKNNIIKLIRPDLINIKAYSSARDEFSTEENMLFLDANESPFSTGLNRYPDPYQQKLKTKIAEIKEVSTDQMLLGNGSDEVIDLIIRLFCTPYRDKILCMPPTYGMYRVTADLNATEVLEVPLTKNFQMDTGTIKTQLKHQPKLIFICSPNNPSGNSMAQKDIEFILNRFEGMVVIDEAYQDFSSQKSWTGQLKNYPNLIVLQTFSKAWGMAGVRLGMCFAHPGIIDYLNRIKPPYNINQLTQDKVFNSLEEIGIVHKRIQIILDERHNLIEKLKNISWVETIYPSDANFVLIEVDDANKRYQELLNRKIVVRNRHKIPGCKNCLRISIGTPEENLNLMQTLSQL